MFNSDDFLSLAEKLVKSKYPERNASLRTAISRAYYSSFHKCKNFAIAQGEIWLREFDINHPQPGKVHSAVRDALVNINFGYLKDLLYGLFSNRVIADYYLHEKVDINMANKAIQNSKRIKQEIESCV